MVMNESKDEFVNRCFTRRVFSAHAYPHLVLDRTQSGNNLLFFVLVYDSLR